MKITLYPPALDTLVKAFKPFLKLTSVIQELRCLHVSRAADGKIHITGINLEQP